ncbi:AlpA family transcriptional regulator [Phycicoccus sp. Soil802]|uniref:helix-turn-helix transcriptional regulator n=1 Tax=Phycicoccus sp. Soil802 TaxID=1736414 RepID=UPI00070399CD|nr:hypothetical protein [Phycicoccus sp. Soil802]KRF22920.1 hypothetical protein ASG91_16230 [Phycicoccus sp. Soil802]
MEPTVCTHLSPRELAGRWRTTAGHLANLRSAGRGPRYLKLSAGKVVYRLADIEEFESERLVSALRQQRTAA